MIYRWIISLYFFAWLVPVGIHDANGGPKFFIYLTNWAFLLFNLYLQVSAIAVTLQFIIHRSYDKENLSHDDIGLRQNNLHGKQHIIRVLLGADYTHEVVWYQKIQWLLISLGLEMAIAVSLLYWMVVYSSSHTVDGENLNVHAVNGVVAVFDICFSGIIIRLLHGVYLLFFGVVYVVFSGIYYSADGINAQNEDYIYPALDYGDHLGRALVYIFLTILIFIPLVHIAIYAMYGTRLWLVQRMSKRRQGLTDVEL